MHENNKFNITNKDRWQVGTKLINDNCILVIHDYDTTKKTNAMLMDNFGNMLKIFRYQGYYELLGYTIPMHFDSSTNNYFLLDEELKNIRVINKFNPTSTHTIGFNEMLPYDNAKRENEIEFDLNTEMTKNTFCFDRVTKKFKHQY